MTIMFVVVILCLASGTGLIIGCFSLTVIACRNIRMHYGVGLFLIVLCGLVFTDSGLSIVFDKITPEYVRFVVETKVIKILLALDDSVWAGHVWSASVAKTSGDMGYIDAFQQWGIYSLLPLILLFGGVPMNRPGPLIHFAPILLSNAHYPVLYSGLAGVVIALCAHERFFKNLVE